MYCPKCMAEYREGFTVCSDCQVPLVEALPAPEAPDPGAKLDLVTVLHCKDSVALALAKGSLDEAGIEYLVNSQLSVTVPGSRAYAWESLPCTIKVARARAKEARALLAPLAGR
jgi:hypothetical protein